jgi:hypothetical protein
VKVMTESKWPQIENEQARHEQNIVNARYASYVEQSAKYGQLLITNLMVINAGALVVFPSLMELIKRSTIDVQEASYASVCFVIGLVLAAASGYSAYASYMILAHDTINERNVVEFEAKCSKEMLELPENMKTIRKLKHRIKRGEFWSAVTFYGGNAFGVASMLMFCLGCFYVRASLL